ncbi:hypothetical protein Pcinc_031144 [Petrolisthes cinctipes]|uniref:Uncharacterized protein n=1 Tax=Petrolisthes cinctipes TaxID=88211 RepID=A0AAE1EX86_PETCI|nr:hypothetical protein Pcinc_031144 [Petrolisthes cinctipes]
MINVRVHDDETDDSVDEVSVVGSLTPAWITYCRQASYCAVTQYPDSIDSKPLRSRRAMLLNDKSVSGGTTCQDQRDCARE